MMSLKKEIYWLTTLLVSFTVIASFLWNIYFTWQQTLNNRYKETTALAQLLDQSFDQSLLNTSRNDTASKEEQILHVNEQLQPSISNIVTSFPDFDAGYYMKELQATVAFGSSLEQEDVIDNTPTSEAQMVYETKKPQSFHYYSQANDGYVVETIYPIIRNGEVIGHSWATVLVEDFISFFKKDLYFMFITLFFMLLIAIVGASLITGHYMKQLKVFSKHIRQATPKKKLIHQFPQELQDIYQEIMTSKETLIEGEKRFRDVVTAFEEFVWEVDLEGNYTYLSDRVESTLGYKPQQLIGTSVFQKIQPPYYESILTLFKQCVHQQIPFRNFHYTKQTADGRIIHLCSNGLPIFNEAQQLIGYRGATRDISIEKQHEQHIHSLAYYDQLTQLPNRIMLINEINQLIQAQQPFAILFLDLDQFKQINDSLSHTAGDELLKISSSRLTNILIENDQLFRFGGDEFIMTLTNFNSTSDLAPRIARIIDTLGQPLTIEGVQLFNTGSIGISVYPEHGETAETLIKNADMAMYRSKANGRNQATFYTKAFESNVTESFALANDLKEALGTNQFVLNYQPQVDLYSGKIVGVEALIRWYHPTKGFIPPDKFIHIAEEHGHILALGKWILHQACVDRKKWLDANLGHFRMAVNISMKQFEQVDFVELVCDTLIDTGLDANYLELEITEGIAMAEPEIVIEKLKRLKEHHIYISIDDFGMGYSSLNYLKRLPINQLKIDRAFIKDIEQKNDYAIVQSIISMAQSLDLNVVAEGVETEQHVEILRSLHCGVAQGYYYYRPMTADDLIHVLTEKQAFSK